jgi:DNA-binding NarL/FixJ family response regulator
VNLRVAVADDQPVIRDGFAALLDAQPDLEVVVRASDGQELVDAVARQEVDLALVDVRMPRMDGIEATRRLTADGGPRVLILTTFDLDEYVVAAVRAGASGFLLKDVTAERLVEAVRLVADGSMLLGPTVTRRLVEDFVHQTPAIAEPPGLPRLTARERAVLLHLARGRSNQEIAVELVVSVETVKSHVSEVLRKLDLRDRIQAVVYAYENGLVSPGS